MAAIYAPVQAASGAAIWAQGDNAAAIGGTVTLTGFGQWTGTPWASITVAFVKVFRVSTGALTVELAAQPVNAVGAMSFSNVAIVAGVLYIIFGFNEDGSLSFKSTATAS